MHFSLCAQLKFVLLEKKYYLVAVVLVDVSKEILLIH